MQPFRVPFSSGQLLYHYKFANENVLHVKTSTFQLRTFYPISPVSLESNCVIILHGGHKSALFTQFRMTHRRSLPLALPVNKPARGAGRVKRNKFKTMMKFHLPGLVTSSGDVTWEPVMKPPPRKWEKVVPLVKSLVALKYWTFISKSQKNKMFAKQ